MFAMLNLAEFSNFRLSLPDMKAMRTETGVNASSMRPALMLTALIAAMVIGWLVFLILERRKNYLDEADTSFSDEE